MSPPAQRDITENLVQYMIDGLPELNIVDTVIQAATPQEHIRVRSTGGLSRSYPDNRQDPTFQISTKAKDDFIAKTLAFGAWNFLRSVEHNLTLPARADIAESSAVQIVRLNVDQKPFAQGNDDGYYSYIFSVTITNFVN